MKNKIKKRKTDYSKCIEYFLTLLAIGIYTDYKVCRVQRIIQHPLTRSRHGLDIGYKSDRKCPGPSEQNTGGPA